MERTIVDRRALDFTRIAITKAVCEDALASEMQRFAAARWGSSSNVAAILKSAVAAGSTSDSTWAAPLLQQAGVEFFDLVRERSLIGRMSGVRRLAFDMKTVRQTSGADAVWVGEGRVIPVSKAALSPASSLPALKLVTQIVETDELLRFANDEAELGLRDDLVRSVSEALDSSLTDPSNAGVAGVSPASITNGAPAIVASRYLKDDLRDLIAIFTGDLTRSFFIGNPVTLAGFSDADRPGIGANGGQLLGIPVLASRKVPVGILILADAGGIGFASGSTEISTSRNGTVQMETSPDSPVTGSTVLISLWQSNLTAIKALQYINWSSGGGSVAVLTGLANIGDSP